MESLTCFFIVFLYKFLYSIMYLVVFIAQGAGDF
jgi:hypothetical protein